MVSREISVSSTESRSRRGSPAGRSTAVAAGRGTGRRGTAPSIPAAGPHSLRPLRLCPPDTQPARPRSRPPHRWISCCTSLSSSLRLRTLGRVIVENVLHVWLTIRQLPEVREVPRLNRLGPQGCHQFSCHRLLDGGDRVNRPRTEELREGRIGVRSFR